MKGRQRRQTASWLESEILTILTRLAVSPFINNKNSTEYDTLRYIIEEIPSRR